MRILQVVSDSDRRGAQVFATDLEVALRDRGHAVDTVALAPGAVGGLGVAVLGNRWPSLAVIGALRARMGRVDVTIAHGSSTGPACALAGIGPGRPFVYRQISDSRFWAPTRVRRWRVRVTLGAARSVVALSEHNRSQLVEWIGVRPDRIAVVPNGVPARRFTPSADPGAARAALGLPRKVPLVVHVGALVPEKGVDLAIRAVGAIDGAHLAVAGDGPERAALARLATETAAGRVHFLGSLPDAEPCYHAADVVVLASRGGDAMPAVLIEAGLCGVPVVATRVGAIPETVVDGETGRIVEADDPHLLARTLASLLDDPGQRRRMGNAARRHCLARYDIARVAEAWEAVLARA